MVYKPSIVLMGMGRWCVSYLQRYVCLLLLSPKYRLIVRIYFSAPLVAGICEQCISIFLQEKANETSVGGGHGTNGRLTTVITNIRGIL